jgi:CPA2 family monovalent cation:H+ antiporter-2
MDHELHVLVNVAIAVSVALVGGLLAYTVRQPVIVGYLLAGIVIGPFTPGFVGDQTQIAALAEIGVIFLMFALGIEFSLGELGRVKGVALLGTLLQVVAVLGAGLGLGFVLGWPLAQALFFGGAIAISSTMVVLKTLMDRGEVEAPHGRVLLGMLVVQDLAVVVMIVALPRLAAGSGAALPDLAVALAKTLAFVAGTLFLGVRVVPPLMSRVERLGSSELFLLMAVALALGTATASALLGLSPALGAFLAGLLLADTEHDHRVIAEVVPMRNLFATLFFVAVGMLIDPTFIVQHLPAVLGLALFIVGAKGLLTLLAVLPFGLGARTAAFTALGLVQIGEFSYVLAQAGRTAGALTEEFNTLLLAASVVTIVLTPLAFALAPRLAAALAHLPLLGEPQDESPAAPADPAPLAGHALVIGYGRVGSQVAGGLRAAGEAVTVVERDRHLVREARAAGVPAVYGDAGAPNVLAQARPEHARLVVVALPDAGTARAVIREARRTNPAVPIVARGVEREDEATLRAAGATAVISPENAGAALLLDVSRQALDGAAAEGG